jgi:hypothetical protein
MSEKQVILAKTEYDAMERELRELKAILDSRTIVKIFVPYEYFREHQSYDGYGRRQGIEVQYVEGKDNDKVITEFAAEINRLEKQLQDKIIALHSSENKIHRQKDEINALKKQTWYEKLFRKK